MQALLAVRLELCLAAWVFLFLIRSGLGRRRLGDGMRCGNGLRNGWWFRRRLQQPPVRGWARLFGAGRREGSDGWSAAVLQGWGGFKATCLGERDAAPRRVRALAPSPRAARH
jgi:hypothetical protein